MNQRIDRFRKWLIVKLGGYIKPPSPVVRFDRIDVPIQKVCAEGMYMNDSSHAEIVRHIAPKLGEELCKAGLVKFRYSEHPYHAYAGVRVVRATVRAIEPEEE